MKNTFVRYGRRWKIPSTIQLRHELRAFSAEEDVRTECAILEKLPTTASWDEIYAHRATENKMAAHQSHSI